jgi:hypothetical protein
MINTRSKLKLDAISITDLEYHHPSRAKNNSQQVQQQPTTHSSNISTYPMQPDPSILDEKNSVKASTTMNWNVLREEETLILQSIKKLNSDALTDVEPWLAALHDAFEMLCYPILHRVPQAATYLDDALVEWYKTVQSEINNDWICFTDRLKRYVHDRSHRQLHSQCQIEEEEQQQHTNATFSLENLINTKFTKFSGEGKAEEWLIQTMKLFKQCGLNRIEQSMCLPFLLKDNAYIWYVTNEDSITTFDMFSKMFLQRYASSMPISTKVLADVSDVVPGNTGTMVASINTPKSISTTHLQQTVADELIKKPSYFRGIKDDVQEWLDRIEQRFKMAKWEDQQKLQFISIHLQEDAYRWWLQKANTITTWSSFVQAIQDSFGSTKANEIAFEQLKCYKQTVYQSVMQYHDKIMELCKKVDPTMSAAMKLNYLMTGVKESLKIQISLQDITTPEAFLQYARKLEDTLSLYNTNQEPQTRSLTTLPSTPTYHRSTSHQPTHNTTNRPTSHMTQSHDSNTRYTDRPRYPVYQQQNIICYTCGTPGHYSRDCTRHRF